MTRLIFIILLLLFAIPAFAASPATYWISPTGAAANLAACSGSTPLSGTSACSYDKANGSGVAAGDTVYYRAGTYSGITESAVVNPYNTGTAGNIITFSAYNSEIVEFVSGTGAVYAVNLDSEYSDPVRSYIKVHGLKFTNFILHLWIRKGTHIEISHCSFIGYPASATTPEAFGDFQATYIYRAAQYNWIHHCTFGKWGYNATFDYDNGAPFGMGLETYNGDNTKYNLVENNEMYAGGHHVAYLNGSYNVYRNNYFHNEPWYPLDVPIFSTRVVSQEGAYGDGVHNLNEGNRIGYGGPKNKDEVGGLTTQVKGGYNIWRYNVWAQSYLSALLIKNYGGDQTATTYNKIYNNTFWHGGYGKYQDYYDPAHTTPSANWQRSYHHPINFEVWANVANNTIKNNLFYQNNTSGSYTLGNYYTFVEVGDSYVAVTGQDISNNWLDSSGDPKFVDISATANPTIDPTTQWNFGLQASSPCLDGGAALTTTNGTGTGSSTLIVNDASYFFYPWGGMNAEIPGATISADWIAIGTVGNIHQISSINYATNTITLADTTTWSNGASVWLYKKSDGSQVLYGTAPDYGAHEYSGAPASTTPAQSGSRSSGGIIKN